MSDAIRRYWANRSGEDFDSRTRLSGRILAIERMAAIAGPHLRAPGTVTLDLGCGTGLLAEMAGTPDVVGVDASAPLLEVARRRMHEVPHADVFELAAEEDVADHVVSLFVADDYEPVRQRLFLGIVFRLLRSGGRFFFAAYFQRDELMREWNCSDEAPYRVHLRDEATYESLLASAGFAVEHRELLRATGFPRERGGRSPLRREFVLLVGRK